MIQTNSNVSDHSWQEDGWHFDYQTLHEPDATRTIVLLPSAQSKTKRRFPYYSRGVWAADFGCNVITVSDPTIQLNSDLYGGWFQGVNTNWVLPLMLKHVEDFLKAWKQGWQNCCFYGSSSGGFAALQAISYYPQAKAFVEIPQIDLREYSDPSMKDLARICYGEKEISDIDGRYIDRISVIETIKKTEEIGRFYYFQKPNDTHHFDKHFLPFSNFLQGAGKFFAKRGYIMELKTIETLHAIAHSPLEKSEAIRRIESFLET